MSNNNDNGLYEFLKGKSLFSPTKANRKRSRSRSKGPRQLDRPSSSNSPTLPNQPKYNTAFNNPQPFNQPQSYNSQTYNPPQSFANTQSFTIPQASSDYPPQQRNFISLDNSTRPLPYTPAQRINQEETASVRWGETASQLSNASQNTVWTGILSYSSSFESARVESTQCLDNLSLKIRREIGSIHAKIDVFNSRMSTVLANELRGVRQKVQQVLEAAFKQSDKYVQEYMKQKEALLAGELQEMKVTLEKELTKVESMKEELNKPHWRKVAGEILSTELEHKVEELLQRSSKLEVGRWQLGDLAGYRIKNIESELREIIRLKA